MVADMFWRYIKAHNIKGIKSIREVSLTLGTSGGAATNAITRLLINDAYFIDYVAGTDVGLYL